MSYSPGLFDKVIDPLAIVSLELDGSTSGSIVQNASATTVSYAIVWPSAQAASSGDVLSNDGAGNLSWVSAGSSGITSITGDATASGPGSAALTLATVNSNVGSFTNANITVNAKGLITAVSNGSSGVTTTVQLFTLSSSDISNGFVTLGSTPVNPTWTILQIRTAPSQFYGVDFTVSGNLLSWTGLGLGTGSDGILAVGDNLTVSYS